MADQKDPNQDPPPENPTFVPLTHSAMAEKSLPGFRKSDPDDSDSEYSDSSDEEREGNTVGFSSEERNKKIQELQRKAYYSVLNAFMTESTKISDKKNQIIEKLMNELKITPEIQNSIEKDLKADLLAQLQRSVSSPATVEKEKQIVEEKPLIKPQEVKETSSSTSVADTSGSGSGWGRVDPYSLVGKWLRVKPPDEDVFEEFIVAEYDPKQEMHRLELTDSNAMEMDDFLSWMDLREIPSDEIQWQGGEKPDFGNNQ